MKLARVGAALAIASIVVGACSGSSTPAPSAGGGASAAPASAAPSAAPSSAAPASAAPGGTAVKIGIELPLSGGEKPNGEPTLNGVKLALSQIQVPGFTVTLNIQDDAVNGVHDPQQGAKNIQTLANDASVLGVVGPFNSSVAKAEIPISNATGLVQCSPANTNISLTKPLFGALDLRKTNPDKIAYVRVATTDDIQGAAGADIAYTIVKARKAFVIDDTETYGKALSDQFVATFTKLGGTVIGGKSNGVPKSGQGDFTSLLSVAKAQTPDVVFFGGVTATGGGLLRRQMVTAGMGAIPFVGGDGISDGAASVKGSFLNLAGDQGDANTYMTVAATHDIPNPEKFAADYKAMFGTDPGAYSGSGYACAQVILEALKKVGGDREKVRAYVTDSSHSYDTVLGKFSFDKNGDTTQRIISDYTFDPGKKDWKFISQKDFGAG
jgi:branched-chain amino acid transport system substrate-binding protein